MTTINSSSEPTEEKITENNHTPIKRHWLKTVLKWLLIILVSLCFVFWLMHEWWKQSGSNEWELEREDQGVKVFTLKTPGSTLIKVRALTQVTSSMATMVKFMEDPSTCEDVGCYDSLVIDTVPNSEPGYYMGYHAWKSDSPGPFATRDAIALVAHYQDPHSKAMEVNFIATPNKLPPDECCIRLSHMHNIWKLTPIPGGKIDIELTMDMALGGGIPNVITSLTLPETIFWMLSGLQEIIDQDKYKNATHSKILEL